MLNNIEEKFDLNTKTSNVGVRSFSGATIEDMKDYSIPLLRKEPYVIIIHAGTNNVRTDKPSIIVDKLVKLQEHMINSSCPRAQNIKLCYSQSKHRLHRNPLYFVTSIVGTGNREGKFE